MRKRSCVDVGCTSWAIRLQGEVTMLGLYNQGSGECARMFCVDLRLLYEAYLQWLDPTFSREKLQRIPLRSVPLFDNVEDAQFAAVGQERYDSIAAHRLVNEQNSTSTLITYDRKPDAMSERNDSEFVIEARTSTRLN